MAKIHMVLQGKGGVGKSFVAAMIAQYKVSKGEKPLCIDTDPVNATFQGYKAIEVRRLEIMDRGEDINPRHFDELIDIIEHSKQDVIIDSGAVSFVPMSHYLLLNRVPELLQRMGHELVIHTVITGGQALLDTLNGFVELVRHFPKETLFIVWLNPYWGPIEIEGKCFENMKAYTNNKDRVAAILRIPTLRQETFGRDLSEMLQERLTFDEALAMASRTIMARQRLTIIKGELFGQMDTAAVL